MAESNSKTGILALAQKRLSRTKTKVLQNLGKADKTTDDLFNENVLSVDKQQEVAHRLQKELKTYIHCLLDMSQASKSLTTMLLELYEPGWTKESGFKAQLHTLDLLWGDFLQKVDDSVVIPIHKYLQYFPVLKAKIAKRGRKLVDFDNCRHHLDVLLSGKRKDEVKIHKAQEEMKEAKKIYEELNNELRTELPEFNNSRVTFCAGLLSGLFGAEYVFHSEVSKVNETLDEICQELGKDFEQFVYQPKAALSKSMSSYSGENGFNEDISGAGTPVTHLARLSVGSANSSSIKELSQPVYSNQDVSEHKQYIYQPKRKAPIAPTSGSSLEKVEEMSSCGFDVTQTGSHDSKDRWRLAGSTYKYFIKWKNKFRYKSCQKAASVKTVGVLEPLIILGHCDSVEILQRKIKVAKAADLDPDAHSASLEMENVSKEKKSISAQNQNLTDSVGTGLVEMNGEDRVVLEEGWMSERKVQANLLEQQKSGPGRSQISNHKMKSPELLKNVGRTSTCFGEATEQSLTHVRCCPEGLNVVKNSDLDSEAERVQVLAAQIMNAQPGAPDLDIIEQLGKREEEFGTAHDDVTKFMSTLGSMEQMAEIHPPGKHIKSCSNLLGQRSQVNISLPKQAAEADTWLDGDKNTLLTASTGQQFGLHGSLPADTLYFSNITIAECSSMSPVRELVSSTPPVTGLVSSTQPVTGLMSSSTANKKLSNDISKPIYEDDCEEDSVPLDQRVPLDEIAKKRLTILKLKTQNMSTYEKQKKQLVNGNQQKDVLTATEGDSRLEVEGETTASVKWDDTATMWVECSDDFESLDKEPLLDDYSDEDEVHTFAGDSYLDKAEEKGDVEVEATSVLDSFTTDISKYYKMAYVDISSSAEDQSLKENNAGTGAESPVLKPATVSHHALFEGADAPASVQQSITVSQKKIHFLTQHLMSKHSLSSTQTAGIVSSQRTSSEEDSTSTDESSAELVVKPRHHDGLISSSLADKKFNFLNEHLLVKHSLCSRSPGTLQKASHVQDVTTIVSEEGGAHKRSEEKSQRSGCSIAGCGEQQSWDVDKAEVETNCTARDACPGCQSENVQGHDLQNVGSEKNTSLEDTLTDLFPDVWKNDSLREDYQLVTVITEDIESYTEDSVHTERVEDLGYLGAASAPKECDRRCMLSSRTVHEVSPNMRRADIKREKPHSLLNLHGMSTDHVDTSHAESTLEKDICRAVVLDHSQVKSTFHKLSPLLPSSRWSLDCIRFTKSSDKTLSRSETEHESNLTNSIASLDTDVGQLCQIAEKNVDKKAGKARSDVSDGGSWSLRSFVNMLLPQTVQILASHTKSYINSCVHSKPSEKHLEEIHKIVIECLSSEDYHNLFKTSSEGSSVDIVGQNNSPNSQPENPHSQTMYVDKVKLIQPDAHTQTMYVDKQKLIQTDASSSVKDMLLPCDFTQTAPSTVVSSVKLSDGLSPMLETAAKGNMSQKSPDDCPVPLEHHKDILDSDIAILEKHFQTVLQDILTKGSSSLRKVSEGVQSPSSCPRSLKSERHDCLLTSEESEKEGSMSLHDAMLSRLQVLVPVMVRSHSKTTSGLVNEEMVGEDISRDHASSWTMSPQSRSSYGKLELEDMNEESFASCQETIQEAEGQQQPAGTNSLSTCRLSGMSSDIPHTHPSDFPHTHPLDIPDTHLRDIPHTHPPLNLQASLAQRRNAIEIMQDDNSSSQDESDMCSHACQSTLSTSAENIASLVFVGEFRRVTVTSHNCSAHEHENCFNTTVHFTEKSVPVQAEHQAQMRCLCGQNQAGDGIPCSGKASLKNIQIFQQSTESSPRYNITTTKSSQDYNVTIIENNPGYNVITVESNPGYNVTTIKSNLGYNVTTIETKPGFPVTTTKSKPGYDVTANVVIEETDKLSQPSECFLKIDQLQASSAPVIEEPSSADVTGSVQMLGGQQTESFRLMSWQGDHHGQLPKSDRRGQLLKSDCHGQLPKSDCNNQLPKSDCHGQLTDSDCHGQLPKSDCNNQLPKSDCHDQLRKSDCHGQFTKTDCNNQLPKSDCHGQLTASDCHGQLPESQ